MSIGQKLEQVADLVYEKGKDAEWNEFWDSLQQNGERRDYLRAFTYKSWTNKTFRPKYDIICDSCNEMFSVCSITDLAKILEEQGVSIMFEGTGQKFNVFTNSSITRIPVLIMPTNSSAYGWFNGCRKLHTVDGFVCNERTGYQSSSGDSKTFANCIELVDIIFGGTVANNCDIHWSTKLSRESILSLLQCLNVAVTGVTITLPSKCIDSETDTLGLLTDQEDKELNTAYTQASANGYSISFL